MNWLDRAISAIDPVRGARRVAARRALDLHQRAYAAARRDHRTMSWQAPGSSATSEIAMGGETVRNRARDLVRNNGYAKKALHTLVDHVVGTGITVTPRGVSQQQQSRIQRRLTEWSLEADFDGHDVFAGLQSLACRTAFEAGDVLIRMRRQGFDQTTRVVPLRIQVLEPDHIDTAKNLTLKDGGEIDRGIEYDAQGRKVALWLLPAHPGEVARFTRARMESQRVPIGEVIHFFERHRPGQDRGISVFAPAILPARDLQQYFEAELVRKKIEACLAGFITSPNAELPIDDGSGESQTTPRTGRLAEKFEPGMLMRLREGEDIRISEPAQGGGIAEAAEVYLREIACGSGVMYEQLTGDFSRVNYSSFRAGNHGFRRSVERLQWLHVIPMLCMRIMAAWTEAALASRMIQTANIDWQYTPPHFLSVDPEKDAKADLANLRMGKVTLSELVAERGEDYLEHLGKLAEDMQAADDILPPGALFDGDPRKQLRGQSNGQGQVQESEDAAQ